MISERLIGKHFDNGAITVEALGVEYKFGTMMVELKYLSAVRPPPTVRPLVRNGATFFLSLDSLVEYYTLIREEVHA